MPENLAGTLTPTKAPASAQKERLLERFLSGSARSDADLLQLLLGYAIPRRDVREMAGYMLERYGSLAACLDAPFDELCKNCGLTRRAAALLKLAAAVKDQGKPALTDAPVEKRPKERPLVMFNNALFKEEVDILPRLPDTESLPEIRRFLEDSLHFNSAQTRRRCALYISSRLFFSGVADKPMRFFARAFVNTPAIAAVCFYRFLKTEPALLRIMLGLFLPNMGSGRLNGTEIKNFLAAQFPGHKSYDHPYAAVKDVIKGAGIGRLEGRGLAFDYREPDLPAFAFILHSEFPEPGMFDLEKLEQNKYIQAMCWAPDRLLPCLYELRNQGIIGNISQIDGMRQFSTRYNLAEVVDELALRENRRTGSGDITDNS